MKEQIVKFTDVSKKYKSGEGEQTVLDNISSAVDKGNFVGVTGDSGSGKTTLLHLMGGLEDVSSGNVETCGKDLKRLSPIKLEEFRRKHISYIFQDYNLIEELTVWENIIFPSQLKGISLEEEKLIEILKILKLEDKRNKFPSQLSGGEQQRTAIVRSIVSKPDIILADEPTGNLDSRNTKVVAKLLQYVNKQYGTTIVMVTHNIALLDYCTDRIKVEDGRIKND